MHGKRILKLLQKIFSWMPLASVIDQKVLVLHGGISDTTDLGLLSRVDRHNVRRLSPILNQTQTPAFTFMSFFITTFHHNITTTLMLCSCLFFSPRSMFQR